MRGPSFRIGQVEHIFEFLPPFTLQDMYGVTAYSCGKCFKKLGDDPFNGKPGKMTPGTPKDKRCVFCNRKCYPYF